MVDVADELAAYAHYAVDCRHYSLWTTKLFANRIKKRPGSNPKKFDSRLTTEIQRSVASIGLVQAFGREADEFNRFQATAITATAREHSPIMKQDSWYWLLVGTIFGIGYAVIFGYGGWMVVKQMSEVHPTLTLGSLLVFLSYVNQGLCVRFNRSAEAERAFRAA